ncbi:glycosyltransferase family 4 protein [Vibrio coralliilyticus]
MKKPAILHICLSQGWGGLEMYPIRTGKEFLQRGYKVYGLCTAGTQVADGMRDAGLEIFEVSSKGQLLASQLLKLNKWLKRRNIEIIHCHKSGDILVSALLSILTRRKTFFTEHMGVTRPKKDLYHKWAYSHVDQIFSISDETYKRNLKALPIPGNRITRLWLGTDIPEQPIDNPNQIATIKVELGLPTDSVIVGNLGRVCSGKGQMELLEAFNLLKDKYPKLHLLLVGGLDVSKGSDNTFVRELKDKIDNLDLTQRVHLVGFRTDTNRMLAAMDIVCLPNHNEAFGLTAIEAMAAKKPIVAANTGALPEILVSTAILTSPLEPKRIATSLECYLLDNKLMKKNSILAYQRAQSEFSMNAHIENLAKYYREQPSSIRLT